MQMIENTLQPSILSKCFLPFFLVRPKPPAITTLATTYFLAENPGVNENPAGNKNHRRTPRSREHLQSPREFARSERRRTHGCRQSIARTGPAKCSPEVVARARSPRSGRAAERIRP